MGESLKVTSLNLISLSVSDELKGVNLNFSKLEARGSSNPSLIILS